jgi:hypothetical protein
MLSFKRQAEDKKLEQEAVKKSQPRLSPDWCLGRKGMKWFADRVK